MAFAELMTQAWASTTVSAHRLTIKIVRPTRLILTAAVLLTATVFAQKSPGPESASGLDLTAFDKSANPCVDFFQYACGNWVATHPIPPDRPMWGSFMELVQRNQEILRGILEKASADDPKRTPVEQKIGDYYYACMDEKTVEAKGYDSIKQELVAINGLRSKFRLPELMVGLHKQGAAVFFEFGSSPDPKNSTMEIGDADQGGLGLPDRDYYLKDDPKSVEMRTAYLKHVAAMLHLVGETQEQADKDAKAILAFETLLAKGSLDRVARRDPDNLYHKMTVAQLTGLCPFVIWPNYLPAVGAPKIESLNVDVPEFFKALNAAVFHTDLDDIKAYLKWQLVHARAPYLSRPFVDENFAFYGKTLTGTQELQPRWKRCVNFTDHSLGEALGEKYVDLTFGAEGKARTLEMVHAIEKAMNEDLAHVSWMTPETKKAAYTKLEAVANKIGYPDKWRDYSSVRVVRDDFAGDALRATEFEVQRQLNKIGKPVDRGEFGMTPPTVNAYYNPLENNINFPAGILQPPFYSNNADDAVNFGAVGAVIGHELTHGFDDQGRKFDAQGNLTDWWTKEDAENFEKRAQCFIDEYSKFKPVDDVHLNGKLTLGENIADNGGIRLAFRALMETLEKKPQGKVDGFTPEQQFFLGYARVWCGKTTDAFARMLTQVDPHSPPKARVNDVVQNVPEFQKAFACKEGQPMVAAPACRVW
jgi:endothelin-converting enzyme/putative endopeptidase